MCPRSGCGKSRRITSATSAALSRAKARCTRWPRPGRWACAWCWPDRKTPTSGSTSSRWWTDGTWNTPGSFPGRRATSCLGALARCFTRFSFRKRLAWCWSRRCSVARRSPPCGWARFLTLSKKVSPAAWRRGWSSCRRRCWQPSPWTGAACERGRRNVFRPNAWRANTFARMNWPLPGLAHECPGHCSSSRRRNDWLRRRGAPARPAGRPRERGVSDFRRAWLERAPAGAGLGGARGGGESGREHPRDSPAALPATAGLVCRRLAQGRRPIAPPVVGGRGTAAHLRAARGGVASGPSGGLASAAPGVFGGPVTGSRAAGLRSLDAPGRARSRREHQRVDALENKGAARLSFATRRVQLRAGGARLERIPGRTGGQVLLRRGFSHHAAGDASMNQPLRIAMFVGCFPVISETFILRQVTGLFDLGHEVDLYADTRGDLGVAVQPEVAKYRLLERTVFMDLPPETAPWEIPVWPLTGRTWTPGASGSVHNSVRAARAVPHLLHCLAVAPRLTFQALC